MITIHSPIWKTLSIGVAQDKLKDNTLIQIDYKTKLGERLYPETFSITRDKALRYPVQYVRGHTLRIIPIRDLKTEKSTNSSNGLTSATPSATLPSSECHVHTPERSLRMTTAGRFNIDYKQGLS